MPGCVAVGACIHIHTHTVHTDTQTHKHAYLHTCIHTYMHTTYVYTYMFVCVCECECSVPVGGGKKRMKFQLLVQHLVISLLTTWFRIPINIKHHPFLPYLERTARIVGIAALNEPRHAMLLSAQNPWVVRMCVRELVTCHVLAHCSFRASILVTVCMHVNVSTPYTHRTRT